MKRNVGGPIEKKKMGIKSKKAGGRGGQPNQSNYLPKKGSKQGKKCQKTRCSNKRYRLEKRQEKKKIEMSRRRDV